MEIMDMENCLNPYSTGIRIEDSYLLVILEIYPSVSDALSLLYIRVFKPVRHKIRKSHVFLIANA